MKRFKTVNTEAWKKPHYCGFVVFTYIIQMCAYDECVHTYARMYVLACMCVCLFSLLHEQIICLQIIDANHTYTHKIFGFVFHACRSNLCVSMCMWVSQCISDRRDRARVTNNLDEKISQVGIFSLMGNLYYLFLKIFGIWWAHITGNHHMSLENADKAKMWMCACVRTFMRRMLFFTYPRTHICKRFYTYVNL